MYVYLVDIPSQLLTSGTIVTSLLQMRMIKMVNHELRQSSQSSIAQKTREGTSEAMSHFAFMEKAFSV